MAATVDPNAHLGRVLDIVHRLSDPATFKRLDVDEDGEVTRVELRDGLAKLGEELAEEELDLLMGLLDADGDGSIGLSEFIAGGGSNVKFTGLAQNPQVDPVI